MAGGQKHRHGLNWENWVTFTLRYSIRQAPQLHYYQTKRRFLLKMERAWTKCVPGKLNSSHYDAMCYFADNAHVCWKPTELVDQLQWIYESLMLLSGVGFRAKKFFGSRVAGSDWCKVNSSSFKFTSHLGCWTVAQKMDYYPAVAYEALWIFGLANFLLDTIEGEDFMTYAVANTTSGLIIWFHFWGALFGSILIYIQRSGLHATPHRV